MRKLDVIQNDPNLLKLKMNIYEKILARNPEMLETWFNSLAKGQMIDALNKNDQSYSYSWSRAEILSIITGCLKLKFVGSQNVV